MGNPGIFESPSTANADALAFLHERLDRHFQKVAAERQQLVGRPPVYAIEHGLDRGDLSVLKDLVEGWVRRFRPPGRHWLPFVVYATEVGYSYEGDEYWPTIEHGAPGWSHNVGRSYIKKRFQEFERVYGGAEPRGRWASHFTIICWPITHALLPADLQRQFAKLLYDNRGTLTRELLEDPRELGRVLAVRSGGSSKRFQQFAENPDLLGHVACALLAGRELGANVDSVALSRITDDLTKQRQARNWLNDARSSANRVRLRGVARAAPPRTRGNAPTQRSRSTLPAVPVFVHPDSAGWQIRLQVPDLTPLLAGNPEVMDELGLIRCRVAGTDGRPKGRGWLGHPGQQVRLDRWPGPDTPVFDPERATSELSEMLDHAARTPSTQQWLFRLGADGVGRIVRSLVVRPGCSYIVVGPNLDDPQAEWVSGQPIHCLGAVALLINVPALIDDLVEKTIQSIGCYVQAKVDVDPVGIVPAAWDGAGSGEWLVGDRPMLRLACTHQVAACTVTLNDSDTALISDSDFTDDAVVLHLPELGQGVHDLRFSFLTHGGVPPIPDVRIDVHMRESQPDRSSGTFRNPIRLLPTPRNASLEDVWDGRAKVEVEGPVGMGARATSVLLDSSGNPLARLVLPVTMPILPGDWSELVQSKLQNAADFQAAYDDATQLTIEVGNRELGTVSATFERELEPLRWGFHRSNDGLRLRLHESADTGGEVQVMRYPFATPDQASPVRSNSLEFWNPQGGLFVARLGSHETRAILPPVVHDLQDLRSARTTVRIRTGQRTPSRVRELVDLAALWSASRSPGDLLAQDRRVAVQRAIKAEIGSLVGGGKWAARERQYLITEPLSIEDLAESLSDSSSWIRFRGQIVKLALDTERLRWPPIVLFAGYLGGSASSYSDSPSLVRPSSARSVRGERPGSQFRKAVEAGVNARVTKFFGE